MANHALVGCGAYPFLPGADLRGAIAVCSLGDGSGRGSRQRFNADRPNEGPLLQLYLWLIQQGILAIPAFFPSKYDDGALCGALWSPKRGVDFRNPYNPGISYCGRLSFVALSKGFGEEASGLCRL